MLNENVKRLEESYKEENKRVRLKQKIQTKEN